MKIAGKAAPGAGESRHVRLRVPQHLRGDVRQGHITVQVRQHHAVFAYAAANIQHPAAGAEHPLPLPEGQHGPVVIALPQLKSPLVIHGGAVPFFRRSLVHSGSFPCPVGTLGKGTITGIPMYSMVCTCILYTASMVSGSMHSTPPLA